MVLFVLPFVLHPLLGRSILVHRRLAREIDLEERVEPGLLVHPVLGLQESGKVGEDELAVGPGVVVLCVGEKGGGNEGELSDDGERGDGWREVGEKEEAMVPVSRGEEAESVRVRRGKRRVWREERYELTRPDTTSCSPLRAHSSAGAHPRATF